MKVGWRGVEVESKWSRSGKSNGVLAESGGDYIIEVNGRQFMWLWQRFDLCC